MHQFRNLFQDERGQATIEWTILAMSMAVIAIWIVVTVGPVIKRTVLDMLAQLEG
jgi:Flp pilus assembly pilin Flp